MGISLEDKMKGRILRVKGFVHLMDEYAKEHDFSVGEVFLALAVMRKAGIEDYPEGVEFWNETVAQLDEVMKGKKLYE